MTVVIHIFPNPPSTRELHPPFQLLPFASLRDFAWTLIVATGCVSARCRRHGLRRCFSLADTKFVHTCGRQSRPVFFFVFFCGCWLKVPHRHCSSPSVPSTHFHPQQPFCFTSICIASFQFAFEVRTVVFLSRTTFESDSCLHFLFPPLLWVKYALVRQLWLRAISQTAVVLPECSVCRCPAHQTRLSVHAGFAKLRRFPLRFWMRFPLRCQFE